MVEIEQNKDLLFNVPSRNRSMEERTPIPMDVLQILANKYNKPVHVIEFMIREEFRQVATLAKRKDMPRILLHNFGSFEVSKKQKQTILYYAERSRRRKEARDNERLHDRTDEKILDA